MSSLLIRQQSSRRSRGRQFAKGNSGRPRGSRNRSTLVLGALMQGEEQELLRKGIELAKDGDVTMLKFLLSRILPRDRLLKINLPPMEFADDAVEAIGSIKRAVAEGTISPNEGAALASLVDSYVRAIDMADVVKRLDALEAKINGIATHGSEPD
jgi:hypothetical protein